MKTLFKICLGNWEASSMKCRQRRKDAKLLWLMLVGEFRATLEEEIRTRQLRRAHQEERIEHHEVRGNGKQAKIHRQILRAEAMKKVWRKCQAARGLHKQGGLSYLEVPADPTENPKECENWRRVDIPEEIKALSEERNQKHFGQSKNC